MILGAVLSVYVLLAGSLAESLAEKAPAASVKAVGPGASPSGFTSKPRPAETRETNATATLTGFDLDSSMIQRALYVLIGITIIGVLYFLVRAVRLRKTSTQRKKYGLLSNYDDTVEMAQLESDEDDTTVYEAKSLRR